MENRYINLIKPGTGSMNGLSGTIHPTMAALQKRRAFLSDMPEYSNCYKAGGMNL